MSASILNVFLLKSVKLSKWLFQNFANFIFFQEFSRPGKISIEQIPGLVQVFRDRTIPVRAPSEHDGNIKIKPHQKDFAGGQAANLYLFTFFTFIFL